MMMRMSLVAGAAFAAALLVSWGCQVHQTELNETLSSQSRRVEVDGMERSYVVYRHADLGSQTPVPLILAFHGGFGSPESFAGVTGLHVPATEEGFVIVYPEGYQRSWNGGDCCGPAHREGVDDVAFVRAILDDVDEVINYDARRVYATGFSNGARFTYRLGCDLADRIAAIAPVGSASSMAGPACSPSRPVPVFHIHGMADEYAPFEGGESAYAPAGEQKSIPRTVEQWVSRNRCAGEVDTSFTNDDAHCITHTACANGATVTLCTVEELAHQWPGVEAIFPRRLGPGVEHFPTARLILEFFKSHAMNS